MTDHDLMRLSSGDHKNLSAEYFNRTWELLEKKIRTPEENERMISMSHASLAHWRQRDDCTPHNLSIGYWQISRVYSVLGQADNAARYGRLCMEQSAGEPPFFIGYAHEALARACKLQGDKSGFESHLALARRYLAQVTEPTDKKWLGDDLDELSNP